MRTLKYIYIKVIVVLLILTQCEIIEQEPKSSLSAKNFFSNEDDLRASLTAAYQMTRVDLIQLGDIRTDNNSAPDSIPASNPTLDLFAEGNYNDQSWEGFYRTINTIHDLLENMENIDLPEDNANQIKGEAFFLRAYNYFLLVQLWGAVPIVQEAFNNELLDRTPESEVYEFILEDLRQSESLLPAGLHPMGRAWVSQATVKALQAKVYLTRAYKSYAENDDFSNAAGKAQEIIDDPNYSLLPGTDYSQLFDVGLTSEGIWEFSYNIAHAEINGFVRAYIPRSNVSGYGGEFWRAPNKKIIDAFETGDLREDVTIRYVNVNDKFDYDLVGGSPYFGKYTGHLNGDTRVSDNNLIVLRLSDMYLVKAEALVQMDDLAGATTSINIIRNRAGLGNTMAVTKEQLIGAISKERFVELCFEGHRWFDLLRTDSLSVLLPNKPLMRPLFPVPSGEFYLRRGETDGFKQNPGYEVIF